MENLFQYMPLAIGSCLVAYLSHKLSKTDSQFKIKAYIIAIGLSTLISNYCTIEMSKNVKLQSLEQANVRSAKRVSGKSMPIVNQKGKLDQNEDVGKSQDFRLLLVDIRTEIIDYVFEWEMDQPQKNKIKDGIDTIFGPHLR